MLATKEFLEYLKTEKVPHIRNSVNVKALLILLITSHPGANCLIWDCNGKAMKDLTLSFRVQSCDSGLEANWSHVGLVTMSAAGNPVACAQCVPVVLGALLYGATAAYPIRDGVRLWISATLFFRKPAEVLRENGARAYMWDLDNYVALLELLGGSARCFNAAARPWIFTLEGRRQFLDLFLKFSTDSTAHAGMESLLYGYFTEKLGEKPQYMSARIHSHESLLVFLKHGENEAEFKAHAIEVFEKKGRTRPDKSRHKLMYAVLDFGELGEAYKSEHPNNGAGEKSNVYTMPPELVTDLDKYLAKVYPNKPDSKKSAMYHCLQAYTALELVRAAGTPCTLADKPYLFTYLTEHHTAIWEKWSLERKSTKSKHAVLRFGTNLLRRWAGNE